MRLDGDDDAILDALIQSALRQEGSAAHLDRSPADGAARIERAIARIESGRAHAGEMLVWLVALAGCLIAGASAIERVIARAGGAADGRWMLVAFAGALAVAAVDLAIGSRRGPDGRGNPGSTAATPRRGG